MRIKIDDKIFFWGKNVDKIISREVGVICVTGDKQSSRGRHALITTIFISPAGEYNHRK